ncbi:MAG: phage tail tape measure protein [Ramlibacter sp.]|nr:phage tail tape measure protein [Ramlibacter sp.]
MTVEAKLRVTPQLEAAVAGLRGLVREVRALESGVQQADRANTFKGTHAGIDGISSRLRAAHAQLLAFFGLQQGAQGVAALARMSDEYQSMNARLRIITQGQAEFNQALGIGRGLAAQYNAPLNETVSLYTRILSAVRPLGGGLREASVATEALLASLKITGAGAAESASAILQFSQALGSGVLRGEEFNAINEAAPRLLAALADGLGKPRSELKALAEQGQLTTSAIVKALRNQLPELKAEAAQIPATISSGAQQARDALQQFVGQEAQGYARSLVDLLKLIAENIKEIATALTLLAVALTAGALGRGAAAVFAGLAGGLAGVTSATALLSVAFRGLLALVGGPVGLVVTLGLLAAAWIGLGNAKNKAQARTAEQVRDERLAVLAEIEDLKSGKAGVSYYERITEARARLRRLDAEANGFAQKSFETFRKGELTSDPGGINLRDPASIKKFEEANKLRSDIVKKFADERTAYVKAKDAEIAAAQDQGNLAEAKRLTRDKAAYLKEQARAESEALKTYDQRGAVTRLAQAKALYDKDFELLADAAQREAKLLQERFDQGLVDLQSYLAEKKRLQDSDANFEIDRLTAKRVAEEEALAKNRKLLAGAKDANARDAAQTAVIDGQRRVLELDTEIAKKERDRLDNARALTEEAQRLSAELRDQQKSIETQLKQARGTETLADIQRRVQDQFAPQLAREFQLGGDGSGTQALIDTTVRREALAKVQRELAQARTELSQREEAVRIAEDAGAVTAEEAERRVLAARREQLPVLQAIAQQLRALAVSPEEQAQAAAAELENKRLSDLRSSVQKTLDANARSGLGQMFADIVSGAKTAGEALRGMLASFAQQMLNLISQRLGNRLFESFGLGRVVDGAASFITSAFGFHQGGVVSAGGASFTRALNVSPLAAALAPRYHVGGIAGMKPGERLSVLQDGEEVLTADDPRHVRNYRGSGVQISSSVTVNGASGDRAQQQGAGNDLNRLIEGAVDAWALKQSRPGGILAKG